MASRFYNDVGKDVVTLTTAKAAEFNAVNGDVNTGFEGVETEIDALSAVVAAADDTYLGFNRIINSDFSVNQRSYAANGTASIAEDEYGHDLMGPTGGSMIYRKETDGDITITSFTRSAGAGIVQLNHTNDDMVAGVGKDLTVSLYVVSLTLPVALYVADTLVYNITTTGWHDFQYTGLSGGDIGIGYTFSNSGTYSPAFRFNSWKVEENISRTTYSKPNYATELDKCLQYYSAPPSTGFSNPNLLINSDFKVNKRVYVSGTGLADGDYGHDLFQAVGGALAYSKEADGDITIDSLTEVASGTVELQQENDELTDAAGEELTVSLYVTSLTDSVYLFIDGVSTDEIDSVGWYSYTYTAGTGGTVGLGYTFSAADVHYPVFRFNSWKVERGSTQTKYKIPEPVAEENRCYHYYTGLPVSLTGGVSGFTLSNDTNTDTDVNITAGTCLDSTGRSQLILKSEMTKQIDATWSVGDDAGGLLDHSVAAVAASTLYNIYLIRKEGDGSVDVGLIAAVRDIEDYYPTGYAAHRWIGWVVTDLSADIRTFTHNNSLMLFSTGFTVITGFTSTSYSLEDLSGACPPGMTTSALVGFTDSGLATANVRASYDGVEELYQFTVIGDSSIYSWSGGKWLELDINSSIYLQLSSTDTYEIGVKAVEFIR